MPVTEKIYQYTVVNSATDGTHAQGSDTMCGGCVVNTAKSTLSQITRMRGNLMVNIAKSTHPQGKKMTNASFNNIKRVATLMLLLCLMAVNSRAGAQEWIRINLLGYTPGGVKSAVLVSKSAAYVPRGAALVHAGTGVIAMRISAGKNYGAYGPFAAGYRLNFTAYTTPGRYYLQAGEVKSPVFTIGKDVYKGSADFALRYMRQQRSGYNPYLQDSCHTHDAYTIYGPMKDGTHVDVSGGWHDATDYLQYVTTSANAAYHLLSAYRDYKDVFGDAYAANGLKGANGVKDVLDEANWGLAWLLKMHPRADWMFNQLADDRDHRGLRLPNKDEVDYGYGPGLGRPVYFATGEPQGLGKYKNRATGVASTAGKFASAFALGAQLQQDNKPYAALLKKRALSAYAMGLAKPGVCQTAPNGAPYFYEEDNYADDMELAAAALYKLTGRRQYLQQGIGFARMEPVTPWLGADTARHYQWYPFINLGHYELGTSGNKQAAEYYRQGIQRVWLKARGNAFYRAVPFIWCSNFLTTSFSLQCLQYRRLTGSNEYAELEQANFDWLFGCNPWGTSMVYGLPAGADTPEDPHSAFTHLHNYPIDGALVDGPVYGSIYNSLKGIKLTRADAYAEFQSALAVYHDDFGDYSTNEPTTDGTAALIYLLAAKEHEAKQAKAKRLVKDAYGAVVRGDTTKKEIALVFTAHDVADGGNAVARALEQGGIRASFFLTGAFYADKRFKGLVQRLKRGGSYLGAHGGQHLQYADWAKRDSTLVTERQFKGDLRANYAAMQASGLSTGKAHWFLPAYEWHNADVARWAADMGLQLVNYTPGTRAAADYTWPQMGKRYVSSAQVYSSIMDYEAKRGLNGFMLLLHMGTDARRTDKFYYKLPQMIAALKAKGYKFVTVGEMVGE